MPNTISVSPAQPNKLVVNGCDLVNQPELSASQNRELQRYINANAHLLGFLNKPKDENEESVDNKYRGKYNSLDRYSTISAPIGGNANGYSGGDDDFDKNRAFQSLNRQPSPATSEYLRRKGVSWQDTNSNQACSHSPKKNPNECKNYNHPNTNDNLNAQSNYNNSAAARLYSPAYSTTDKRRAPYNYSSQHTQPLTQQQEPSMNRRTESPWGNSSTWSRDSRGHNKKEKENWKGFPVQDIPLYSSLERHPDDYNRYETHRYREHQLQNVHEQPEKKFYGYGDHRVSGIELKHKPWTGGEIITDPNFVKKSLKPRRTYYSPIGDGVVEADGIELKRGPKDLTPRVTVRHEKYVEKGSGGANGRRLLEETWSDGSPNNENNSDRNRPPYNNRALEGNVGNEKGPYISKNESNNLPNQLPNITRSLNLGPSRFPKSDFSFNGDLDGAPKSGRSSALSIGTDGLPREGWTKTFIVNPRELINQYANETQTIVFDLDDHTPKVTTTIKETITSSPSFRK